MPVGEVDSMASMSDRGLAAKTFLRLALHVKAFHMLEDASSLGSGLKAAKALASRAVSRRPKAVMAAGRSYPMSSCAN